MNLLTHHGEECALGFQSFGLPEYDLFVRAKSIPEFRVQLTPEGFSEGLRFPARFAHLVGADVKLEIAERLPFPDFLFDDQKAIVELALDAKRFAVWKDCGLGKTLEQLEWARQVSHITGGRVLIVTFNEIVDQTIEECQKFYGVDYGHTLFKLQSREELKAFCKGEIDGARIAITNYEKFNPEDGNQVIEEVRRLSGIVLDESSRLKTGGGKQKWAIIKSTRGIPYKLSGTATPAPNDVMEFASQASFLERIRDEHDVIWTYFTRDPKTNEWTVKKHARPHFFRWMSSWSIYVADPRAYGWRKNSNDVPQPKFIYEEIAPTNEQLSLFHATNAGSTDGTADMFGDRRLGMVNQLTLLESAKGFIYDKQNDKRITRLVKSLKPSRVAEIAKNQIAEGRQTLIWCEYDSEVAIIAGQLRLIGVNDFQVLQGDTPKPKREPIIQDFIHGKIPVLVTKARLLGWGRNFQNCTTMIFSGFSDSFESFYQAVRRAFRYGQTKELHVYIPFIPQLEGPVLRNLLEKVNRFQELIKDQESAYIEARKEIQ